MMQGQNIKRRNFTGKIAITVVIFLLAGTTIPGSLDALDNEGLLAGKKVLFVWGGWPGHYSVPMQGYFCALDATGRSGSDCVRQPGCIYQ